MTCLIKGCNFVLKNIPHEAFVYAKHADSEFRFQTTNPDIFPYLLVNIGSGVSIVKVIQQISKRIKNAPSCAASCSCASAPIHYIGSCFHFFPSFAFAQILRVYFVILSKYPVFPRLFVLLKSSIIETTDKYWLFKRT